MNKRIAVYAGSFDPITNGHIDIVRRALKIFDELHVVIAIHPEKSYYFSSEERVKLAQKSLEAYSNIVVAYHDGLVIDYARQVGSNILVRGLRALSDFDHEFHMATINQELRSDIETIFITTGANYFYINSSAVKELAKHHADISPFVPNAVVQAFKNRI